MLGLSFEVSNFGTEGGHAGSELVTEVLVDGFGGASLMGQYLDEYGKEHSELQLLGLC